jgi:hypothetical protein
MPPKFRAIPQSQLVQLLKASIGTIDDLIKRIQAYDTMSAEEYFQQYHERVRVRRTEWPIVAIAVADEYEMTDEEVQGNLQWLSSLNAINRRALWLVNNGQPVINMMLALVDHVVGANMMSKEPGGAPHIARLYGVNMIDGVVCSKCKCIREREYMAIHELHPECNVEADRNRMREAKMVKVEDIGDAIAVRMAGVNHELVSEFWAIYAPEWVQDAIKIYKQNETYAGLSLSEFLKQMKPNDM